ncbi:MAG: glycosyltransferase family 2 protein [Desulfocucumaceae bacterium]
MSSSAQTSPRISIIIPVFNRSRHLKKAVQSAISQLYDNFETIIYDDCSTDPEVRNILGHFRNTAGVKILWGKKNLGISMATNYAIIHSTGDYLAFFDCDDVLHPHALATAAKYIKLFPQAHYFYSNRENIDEEGRVAAHIDFSKYSSNSTDQQILEFMFASHLKIIKKETLYEVGLLKKEFDSCQDYDLALRMSKKYLFRHIPEYLYQYRIYPEQISQVKQKEQARLSYHARDVEVVRRLIFEGILGRNKISIIMLTLNRWQRTKESLEALAKNTSLPYQLIILDNNSTDETAQGLQLFSKLHTNVELLLEGRNLGCSGGRKKALSRAKGDFIVMLDNDIGVTPWWLENLLVRLKESQADAACCRVVFPDGKIQYNGGRYSISREFILFSLIDHSIDQKSLESLITRDCDWLPGGATIYRRRVFDRVAFCEGLYGGLEDNDLSLQMAQAGFKMVNSPLSRVIHHHTAYEPKQLQDPVYLQSRYDWNRLKNTMSVFYRRNGLIVYDPWLLKKLGIPSDSREAVNYFKSL